MISSSDPAFLHKAIGMLAIACSLTTSLQSQHPALNPTASTTIVVNGPLHYSSIDIPNGVTVRFVAPNVLPRPFAPTVIYCDGDANIRGTLSVGGEIGNGFGMPAGMVNLGAGLPGNLCFGVPFPPAQGGSHAGNYGTVIPFGLEGGSSGGDMVVYDQNCWNVLYRNYGGTGGGTLVLLANGRIDVHGTVTADGIQYGPASTGGRDFSGGGSGGSILLRSAATVTVFPTGSVTARGGTYQGSPAVSLGAPGYVRIDAYASTPLLQGLVDPPPTVLELPHLHTTSAPQIGTTWTLGSLAPENCPVFVCAALQPAPGTPTPFGPLGIDLPLAFTLAMLVTPQGHDPIASLPLAIPNQQSLRGQNLWFQALAAPPNLPPRLTNTLAVTIQ
jgi:hypothetical protein